MKNFRLLGVVSVALACLLALLPTAGAAPSVVADDAVSIFRVAVDDDADVAALVASGVDLLESRGADYLLVVGTATTADALREQGYRVTVDRQLSQLPGVRRSAATGAAMATFYGGYRTVEEHDANLQAVAAAYPNLATVVDYGNSWRKVFGRADGNDLMTLCITNKQAGDCALNPNSAKPRAVVIAAVHARELATSEVAWRLIDELTQNYGTDAEITHILDTTEVWVIPVVNPDGREIVEEGGNAPYLQRKNANDILGDCLLPPTGFDHHGVDLNRNANYQWGGVGTSTDPCSPIYRGTSAASEPEQANLELLFSQLWPNQKAGPNDPVDPDATGVMITLHSFGEYILLPPGGGGVSPDDAGLRSFAFRMSHYNDYLTGTAPEVLYAATGATDDWTYGRLGVASFTYELGANFGSCGGFTPTYSCIDSTIWPTNRDALLYSLKVAGAPYSTPRGPTTTLPALATVAPGSALQLTATVDDDAFGNRAGSVNRPTAETVTEAEYYLDAAPADGGTPIAMTAADGAFDAVTETVQATVPASALALGDHTVYVRGRNAAGFWGPFTVATVTVSGPKCAGFDVSIDMNTPGVSGVGTDDADVILGTPGSDAIDGGAGDDVICGGGGRDTVQGGAGNDLIYGGGGHDNLSGGDGNDTIYGQPGGDTIRGDGGQDTLLGGTGFDRIEGGDDDDFIQGSGGNDTLYGGAGNDALFGKAGSDKLFGEAGNDELYAAGGNDELSGGAGNDRLQGASGNDQLDGSDGVDLLYGQAGNDNLLGGAGSDELYGAAGDDVLNGEAGDDRLLGGTGNDEVLGGAGADTLFGQAGNDVIDGGTGADQCVPGPGQNTVRNCLARN